MPSQSAGGSRAARCSPPSAQGPTQPKRPDVKSYCTNIAAAATDARFAWQTIKLKQLEDRIKDRVKDLDAKEAELRGWIDKRAQIEKEAGEKLVGIYTKMKPETAATQIGNLDDTMAAAVLGQMNPRQAQRNLQRTRT